MTDDKYEIVKQDNDIPVASGEGDTEEEATVNAILAFAEWYAKIQEKSPENN